jgi:hypothetical protein
MLTTKQAHIGLKKPCKNCPFTADKANSILLSKGRRESIISELISGKSPTFQCHKTTKNLTCKKDAQACAGAITVVKQRGGMAIIERMALIHGVIDTHYFDDAVALSADNFELGI